jgi:hypothetical protein
VQLYQVVFLEGIACFLLLTENKIFVTFSIANLSRFFLLLAHYLKKLGLNQI